MNPGAAPGLTGREPPLGFVDPLEPSAPGRRGLPGPASAEPEPVVSPRSTPVPTSAHLTPRAIRVHRSPR